MRRRFWQAFFAGPVANHLLAGRRQEAEKAMRTELVGNFNHPATPTGEAWIVGAGPGDPGLVTIRAQQLLAGADVVLYDRLVSSTILDFARKEAELIFVGKRAGERAMSQDAINALLVDKVRQGHRVCRLKGGDPFIFGRGGEEAQALADAGLPFQIVPGVTAAIGSAAYAGIPLTLRGVSASVTLATATLNEEATPDWARIIRAGDTLALYMGSGKVAAIRQQFLQLGVEADTPVAFVENGTTAAQRSLLCTVSTMHDVAANAGVTSPAIIYIGRAVAAATDLSWFEGSANARGFSSLLEYEKVSAASM
jgi:uroporphyrin-III C-methyltransferase/precorrin-2 dehydrogenase/sirohydrochlorin ferrochelatase